MNILGLMGPWGTLAPLLHLSAHVGNKLPKLNQAAFYILHFYLRKFRETYVGLTPPMLPPNQEAD